MKSSSFVAPLLALVSLSCAPLADADPHVSFGVHVVGESLALPEEVHDGHLVYDARDAWAIAPGDFIVSDVLPEAPYGLLRRVVDWRALEDHRVALDTESATLGDLPQEMLRSGRAELLDPGLKSGGFIEARTRVEALGVFGEVRLRVRPDIELVWEHDGGVRPRRVAAIARLEVRDFELRGRVGAGAKAELLRFELPPLRAYVGVPLVLRTRLVVSVEGKVFAEGVLDGGAVLDRADIVAGFEYERGVGWTEHRQLEVGTLSPIRPSEVTRSYAGRVELPIIALEALPYGQSAFRFFAGGRLIHDFRYRPGTVQPLRVSTTPRVEAGLKVRFFGFASQELTLKHDFDPLVTWEGSIDALPAPTPWAPAPERSGRFAHITDVPPVHWAAGEIEYLVEHYLAGYPDGTFRPDRPVTRAELAAMVAVVLDPSPGAAFEDRTFSDIEGHWAERAILQLARAGWAGGYLDGTYRPDTPVTRLEAHTIVSAGAAPSLGDPDALARLFDDEPSIPGWARAAIAGAVDATLVVSHPDVARFRPSDRATRAEVCALLYRALLVRDGMPDPVESRWLVVP